MRSCSGIPGTASLLQVLYLQQSVADEYRGGCSKDRVKQRPGGHSHPGVDFVTFRQRWDTGVTRTDKTLGIKKSSWNSRNLWILEEGFC